MTLRDDGSGPTRSVLVLGSLGGGITVDDLRVAASNPETGFEVNCMDWASTDQFEVEIVLANLIAWRSDVLCLGADVPIRFAVSIAKLMSERVPQTSILLIGTADPELRSDASRSGIREILPPGSGLDEIREAISGAMQLSGWLRKNIATERLSLARVSRQIVVLSPKGGSGKTTIAVNLASVLSAAAPGRVVLVDFDCQFGDVATCFGLDPERTLTDLGAVADLDVAKVKLFLSRANGNSLFLLPSSGSPDEADVMTESLSRRILELLSTAFDYVIVDTAAGIDDRSLAAAGVASDLLFVASMDVMSIRNLVKELEILDRLGITTPKRHFILNNFDDDSMLKVPEIEAAVGMPVEFRISASPLVVRRANEGRIIVNSDPASTVARQFHDLGAAFSEEMFGAVKSAPPSWGPKWFRRLVG
jgi:pilus assembly protein CpaE